MSEGTRATADGRLHGSLCSTNLYILRQIGLAVDNRVGMESKYVVYWPDGSYRWIFSLRRGRPGYLAFHRGAGLRARCLEVLITLMCLGSRYFELRVENNKFDLVEGGVLSEALTNLNADAWDVFAGSPGKRRNIVVALRRGPVLVGYLKTPANAEVGQSSENIELRVYEDIARLELDHIIIPEVKALSQAILLSPLDGKRYGKGNIDSIVRALSEIAEKSSSRTSIESYLAEEEIVGRFNKLLEKSPKDSRVKKDVIVAIAQEILRKTDSLEHDRTITTSFGIVDFTPWNSFIIDDEVGLIDVEFASNHISLGYDLVHFHVQDWIMSGKRLSARSIQKRIVKEVIPLISLAYGVTSKEARIYVDLYTIKNTLRVLELYMDQHELHPQALAQIVLWQDCADLWVTE